MPVSGSAETRRTVNVLLGPTRSGKTSLMRVMAGLDRPTAGRLLADGLYGRQARSADADPALVQAAVQEKDWLWNNDYNLVTSVNTAQKGFDSAMLFGIGVGYQFNNWFRADLTGEYRSRSNFHGLDIVRSGGSTYTDEYTGSKSEWLMLLNGYVDLGTWYNLTPFVGAGIGASYNTIHDFKDTCSIVSVCTGGSVATGKDNSKWNFAWALHAGVAYKVTNAFAVELAYRYVNLGDASSGDLVAYNGTNQRFNPMEFRGITSHDFKLGLRWMLDAPMERKQMIDLPPLMRKG